MKVVVSSNGTENFPEEGFAWQRGKFRSVSGTHHAGFYLSHAATIPGAACT